MTLKEILPLLGNVKSIHLGFDGLAIPFDPENKLMLMAYGDFICESIGVFEYDPEEGATYEITVATVPVKGCA